MPSTLHHFVFVFPFSAPYRSVRLAGASESLMLDSSFRHALPQCFICDIWSTLVSFNHFTTRDPKASCTKRVIGRPSLMGKFYAGGSSGGTSQGGPPPSAGSSAGGQGSSSGGGSGSSSGGESPGNNQQSSSSGTGVQTGKVSPPLHLCIELHVLNRGSAEGNYARHTRQMLFAAPENQSWYCVSAVQ